MKYDLGECISDCSSALTDFAESANILGACGAKLIKRLLDTIVENFSFESAPPSNNYRKLHGMPMVRRRRDDKRRNKKNLESENWIKSRVRA